MVHTSHPTFGDLIEAPEGRVVWAPEFLEFPGWAHGARLLFAEAAGWERPIRFAGGVGGHLHVPVVVEAARRHRVGRLVFAHIGRPTIWAMDRGSGPPSASSHATANYFGSRAGDSRRGCGEHSTVWRTSKIAGGLSGQAGPGTDAGAVR